MRYCCHHVFLPWWWWWWGGCGADGQRPMRGYGSTWELFRRKNEASLRPLVRTGRLSAQRRLESVFLCRVRGFTLINAVFSQFPNKETHGLTRFGWKGNAEMKSTDSDTVYSLFWGIKSKQEVLKFQSWTSRLPVTFNYHFIHKWPIWPTLQIFLFVNMGSVMKSPQHRPATLFLTSCRRLTSK